MRVAYPILLLLPSPTLLPQASIPTLRALMRERTAAAHQLLEATPVMRSFAGGNATLCDYRIYLRRQFRLHASLEPDVGPWVPHGWKQDRLVKVEWLLDDLHAVGAETDYRPIKRPAITSTAEALGTLYVLEGGTLGLQVLRKRLHPDHPALHGAGRFMRGYELNTGRNFREFIDRLETLPASQWPPAIAAAIATFSAFQRVYAERAGPRDG